MCGAAACTVKKTAVRFVSIITLNASSVVSPMAATLKAHGNSAETIFYKDVGHVGIILSLLPGLRWKAPLREDMLAFIAAH